MFSHTFVIPQLRAIVQIVLLLALLPSPISASFLVNLLESDLSSDSASSTSPPPTPFGFGFLAGFTPLDGEATISTWNDIHLGCDFSTAEELQADIDAIDPENTVIIALSVAWHQLGECNFNGPWGTAPLFMSKIAPLVATLNANRERLFALWLFDEPDAKHDGPEPAELIAAIDYLHEQVPGVPTFVNWFSASRNQRVPNADWYSTTKGEDPADLVRFGKPMFLWWFDNDANPNPLTVNLRWDRMIGQYYTTNGPPIASLGWCCDKIIEEQGVTDNSVELNAYLANIGLMRKETNSVSRAAYARRDDKSWYLFRRELDDTLTYTNDQIFPEYRPFPIGGTSAFYPSIQAIPGPQDVWIRILRVVEDDSLQVAWITPDDTWSDWFPLPGDATARPDVFTFNNDMWQAIRGVDDAIYVQRGVFGRTWVRLGGQSTSAPFFKVVDKRLRVAIFGPAGRAHSRQWNGTRWEQWRRE